MTLQDLKKLNRADIRVIQKDIKLCVIRERSEKGWSVISRHRSVKALNRAWDWLLRDARIITCNG